MITPQDITEAKLRLGAQLAALRGAAALSQHDLATAVVTSRSSIANIERGRQPGTRDFWARCDTVLGGNGVLVRDYDASRDLQAQLWRQAASEAAGQGSTAPEPDSDPAVQSVEPELALHWLGLLGVLASSHNLLGPRQIHDAVCRESAVIRRYRHDARGDTRTALMGAESRWAEFASWTADNLGDLPAATFWLDRSLTLARQAGAHGLAAYILMRQAQQAADRLDGPRTLQLTAAAARSESALTDRDRALCAVRQAQGHALTGNAAACRPAISQAYRLAERASDHGTDEDPATIGKHCVPAYVHAHEAYCQLLLGQPAAAAGILEHAITRWPEQYRQDRSLLHAWLALAHASVGRHAEAGAEGSRALAMCSQAWSARTIRTLSRLDTLLAVRASSGEAAQFRASYALLADRRI